ncbi:MAG: nucleotidyl transferase AbiEii/AbiGii toxin family protein [Phycisphaerales bacterium]|nr:nucleotidyl transferase AbiEii/AbiGii toxin family protein [Phycisphaerales bacterium]
MIQEANITAWRATVPWADDAQVEQDLVLSRAVTDLFADSDLRSALALRGGTALNKLFIEPPVRYSEDIDLVQTHAAPIGPVLTAIRRLLDPWLGNPRRSRATASVTLLYRFQSELPPVRPLRLKIECNTREHFTVLGYQPRRITVANPWYTGEADVSTFQLDELMGTKLRALYQRRKGRDLFDLWLCLTQRLLNHDRVVACFTQYMKHEGKPISRAEFEHNIYNKEREPSFLDDVKPLLASSVSYDAKEAMKLVRQSLIERLPGEPWRGPAVRHVPRSRGKPRPRKGDAEAGDEARA